MSLFASAYAADDVQPSASAWPILQAKYYGDRPMGVVDEQFLSIEAPASTPDPAATPLTVHLAHDPRRPIRRLRVFIDNNPSPLVATFDMNESIPLTRIDLRVRVDRFTSVRAVAESSDGSLEMRSTWVKASGGCSAPPTAAAAGTLGEIRLRPSADGHSLQIGIRHPNSSGFQIDPRSGYPIPAHFISHLSVSAAGKPLLDAELGISISENPTLGIESAAAIAAPVAIDALDSVTQAHFTAVSGGDSGTMASSGR